MRVILLPLLLGHALGDFYLQTDMIAKEKTQRLGTLFLHLLIYATAMAAVLFICIQESTMLVVVWALASV
ncbi:MAG: DUF3307 domain-containing protein, partial [Clostridiales bacterium]|nr:DUF3307 domain-containing protein [Clostridiales bacterium]